MNNPNMPVRKTMCATCPFQPNSKYECLKDLLAESALIESSRICHSTGSNNAVNNRTGKRPHICRGTREIQLNVMTELKMISEPTDIEWNNARVKIGMKRQEIKDP